MAEAIGVVSGGVGLASFALQLAESAVKLRSFYKTAKNAPESLEDTASYIETFSQVLLQIERDRVEHDDDRDRELLLRCIKECRKSTGKIVAVAEKLEQMIKKAKMAGRIYYALQEGSIAALCADLERAKSSLLQAHMLYMHSCQSREMDRLRSVVLAIPTQVVLQLEQPAQQQGPLTVLDLDPGDAKVLMTSENGRGFYKSQYEGLENRKRSRGKHQTNYRFQLPYWFSSRVWHLAASRASGGWDFQIRSYNVRPHGSRIFRLCSEGDLHGVQKLFADGEASPLDRTPDGIPLLATWYPDLEGDVEFALSGILYPPRESSQVKLLRAVTGLNTYDLDLSKRQIWLHAWSPSCVQIILEDPSQQLHLESPDVRFERALQMSVEYTAAEDFLRVCGLEQATAGLAAFRSKDNWAIPTALQFAAGALGHSIRACHGEGIDAWARLLQQLIRQGADVHGYVPGTGTVFAEYCLHCPMFRALDWLRMTRKWASWLGDAGTDLEQYARTENELLQTLEDDGWRTFDPRARCYYPAELRFGSTSDECTIVVRHVDRVPLYQRKLMPGAWTHGILPDQICWQPPSGEEFEWTLLRWHIFIGEPLDPNAVSLEEQPWEYQSQISGTQDDCRAVALMLSRAEMRSAGRTRRASQPPCTRHREKEYWNWQDRSVEEPDWLPSIHLCPLDGRRHFLCSTPWETPAEEYGYPDLSSCIEEKWSQPSQDYWQQVLRSIKRSGRSRRSRWFCEEDYEEDDDDEED